MKFIRVCLLSALLSFSVNSKVNAGAAAGGASEWTQILNNVQLVLSYVKQYDQYKNMIKRLKNMDINTIVNGDLFYESAYGELQELGDLLKQGENLAYSAANIEEAFRNKHESFDEWALKELSNYDPQLIGKMAKEWDTQTTDSIVAALKHTKLQYDKLGDEKQTIENLKSQSETVEGRLEAIQAATSVAIEQLHQTQKLRASINNLTQMQANFMAIEQERRNFEQGITSAQKADLEDPSKRTDGTNGAMSY